MTPPHFPRRVSVTEVVHNARCELYEAVSENIHDYPWLENMAATFDFSFIVDRDLSASTDTTFLVPIQSGTFTLGIKANLNQSATSTYVLKINIIGLGRFQAAADCGQIRSMAETPQRLLNGEIGLRRWLNEVIPQLEAAWIAPPVEGEAEWATDRRKYAGKTKSLAYAIKFGVTANGSLLPSWDLLFPSGRRYKPMFSFTAARDVTHELIFGLTPTVYEPPDLSNIHAVIDGKKVIVGRRVCVTNADRDELCWENDEALKAVIDAARKKTKAAQTGLNRLKQRKTRGVCRR